MFAVAVSVALLAASNVLARPLRRDDSSYSAPATYAQGFLEDYATYNTRYVALGCAAQHDTDFFDDCCHPMLASEHLSDDRKAYCTPSSSSSAAVESSTAYSAPAETYSAPAETSTFEAAVVTSTSTKKHHTSTEEPSSTYTPEATSTYVPETTEEPSSTYTPEATTSTKKHHTSTSSSEAAAVTTESSSVGSAVSDILTGTATFFYQNGVAGACGDVHSDSDYIAAVSYDIWGTSDSQKSDNCGKYLELTNTSNNKSIKVKIADLCPTCVGKDSIDLSYGAFTALAKESDGVFDTSYTFV